MKSTVKIHFPKWQFIVLVCLCFLYAALLHLIHAIHFVSTFNHNGGENLSSPWNDLYMLFLLLPFLITFCILLKHYGGKQVFFFTWHTIKRHWLKFAIYLFILYYLISGLSIGDLYLSHSFLPLDLWLSPTHSSYVLMAYLHYMAEPLSSVLFLILMPLVCYVSWSFISKPSKSPA